MSQRSQRPSICEGVCGATCGLSFYPRSHDRERRGSIVVVDFAMNVFFRRTGVGLSDHL